MITYLGNFKWSNGSKTSELTEEGYRGFNGCIVEYAPGNTSALVNAIVASGENNDDIIEILNTMFSMNPFYSMSSDSAGWRTYCYTRDFLRATKDYKGTALERIVHVVLNKYHLDPAQERSILLYHRRAIQNLLTHFEEAEIIDAINNCKYTQVCDNVFTVDTVTHYLNEKKLMQYLPPNTPENLIEWGLQLVKEHPKYVQAIAAMIRNGVAQMALTKYNFYGRILAHVPSLFLNLAERLNLENPNPNGNILNKINQMHLEYEAHKEELVAARIAKTKDKLEYRAHGFCVVVPTTRAEYKAEADAQHNCLYNFNYFDDVMNGDTNIAFVRKEDDPETPFITCQINNRGRITQFYTKNNETPIGDDINEFYSEWARHLRQTFNH